MKKAMSRIWNISVYLLFAISVLLAFSVFWMIQTWPGLHMDELVFHLVQGVSGAGENMARIMCSKPFFPQFFPYVLWPSFFTEQREAIMRRKSSRPFCPGRVFGYADGSLLLAGELQENPAGYIEYLSSLDPKRYVTLLSGQGDFTAALNKEIMDSLFDLGCLNDLSTQRNISYIAIRDQNGMFEQSSLNVLRYKGKAGNKLNVQMISASEQEGSISSIRIDDGINGSREYSLKKDGINIAVYDQKENTVVSRASFDTVTQPPCADVQIAENKDGNLEIKIETIRNKNNVTDVYGILFDEVNPANKIPFTLKQDEDGVFSGRVSVKDVNAETMHLRIMASDLSGVPVIIYKEDRTDTDS